MTLTTHSPSETKNLAKLFAEELAGSKKSTGAFVAVFKGDLGAGKTEFIRAFLKALGVRQKITSPTFTLMRKYKLPFAKNFQYAYHLDCYRLNSPSDISTLGFGEIIKDPKALLLIEWPERIYKSLPKERITISIGYGKSEDERIFEIK